MLVFRLDCIKQKSASQSALTPFARIATVAKATSLYHEQIAGTTRRTGSSLPSQGADIPPDACHFMRPWRDAADPVRISVRTLIFAHIHVTICGVAHVDERRQGAWQQK